ncbi:MAG TPA: TauD/TfdA family dioxygenase, partial [Acidimicrobiales bacterium]
RKGLFVNKNFTTGIVELAPEESDALLAMLYRRLDSPEVQVRWKWAPASVAFWDNRATQHCAIADYTERRVMHRCMMRGTSPIAANGNHEQGKAP